MKPGKNARFPVVPVKARDASHCEEFSQISFDSEEFAGKWIVTDIEETTILAIAASHEELQQILSSPDFPEDVTIHTGPIEQIGKDGECFTPS